ncbi:MAG: NADPH:quinone reductase [Planctomycetales bacterium]|nr:NADPH:quinone reductase [Planctomycetales bacterium]
MKAAYIEQTGGPEAIQFGDLPDPQPTGSQVLVKVAAVSVNPIDTYIRNGANYWELPKPYIIGSDLAGEVIAVGPEAKRYRAGDRVWGSNQGLLGRQGTFAEQCAVDECWLYPTPTGVSDEAVAACALVGITAHLGLFHRAQLKSGETLFVHGGSGGVGSMVIQMAKAAGARVFTTAGSPEKQELCRQLGADCVVNYKTENVVEAAQAFAPTGFNVVWETMREPNFDELVSLLAERGRLVLMAGRDARPEFPVGPFYVKGCSLLGFVMFKATPDEQSRAAAEINALLASGSLAPHIGHRLPLSEAANAHRLQEANTLQHSGTLAGKIVLTPAS